ncbi:ABC transporter substrate-binding protein [Devosia rhizoryzae]|uniref:Carbohydrate ABC transporter substrate-binding protein n=1 Tax=Devosia rhizoryzae TaxID=2774137 RepID=A0ABX7CC09_9HYPH|nr:extracellular solute-binding protein [Devosia rhizoryzae]QQR39491.1 hypothetical protein JI748_00255 [Devosia rhizoryzae]
MNKLAAMAALGVALSAVSSAAALAQDANQYRDAAVAEAKRIAEGIEPGGYVEVIGQNSGAEGQTLQDVYAAFSEATGIEVRYTGTQDITAIVQSRIQAGNPPNVADIQLGEAIDLAENGQLVDLTAAFGDELTANFGEMLLETASYDGKVFGVYQGMNPFMVWYNPKSYTGPEAPQDWQAIVDWTNEQAKAGNAVWCAAQNAGAGSGFPGAQIVDNIFLKKYGPELYAQWGSGELPWTSEEVKWAFEEFGRVVMQDSHVQGGVIGALSTPISTGYTGLVTDPATCQISLWGAWVPGLIGETAVPGDNIDFFRVPASDPAFYGNELFQSAISVGFTDDAATKAFLQYIASTPAQTYLASLNRWPVANQNVSADVYPSPLLQKIASEYLSGDVQFAAGPNVLNGAATGSAYYKAIVSYMQNPGDLDNILAGIEATTE